MLGAAALALAALVAGLPSQPGAQTPAVAIDNDDIGGVVTGPKGPEAGVWVIAETTDLPTKYAKIVVTDDQGRYVLPDLPKAKYKVWVRGYGLVDSAQVDAEPGRQLNLTAVVAPNEKAAAEYYPPIYWYAMLRIPPHSEFPGTGPKGNGINPAQRTPAALARGREEPRLSRLPCDGHARHARDPARVRRLPQFARRLDAPHPGRSGDDLDGQRGVRGSAPTARSPNGRTGPIASPPANCRRHKPTRPQGVERNVVLTLWDWSDPKLYLHDLIATDRRKPTVNANGKIYGSHENSSDLVPVLDPVTHTASSVRHPVLDPKTPSHRTDPMTPSAYWGEEPIWDAQANQHNPMMDEKGRPWFTVRLRPAANPAFCRKGSDHPSAKVFPIDSSTRHVSMFDPTTGKFTLIDTCFPTHHLIFAEDADNTLWLSSGGAGAQRGRLGQPQDPGGDRRSPARAGLVAVRARHQRQRPARRLGRAQPAGRSRRRTSASRSASTASSSIRRTARCGDNRLSPWPGYAVRFDPKTQLTEIYSPPLPGYGGRGADIDRNGVFWTSLASGHLGEFDRRKCKVLNGPTATGDHCPEGWTLHRMPGPNFEGVKEEHSAEGSYYTWVDWFNTGGLGENVPIATGNQNSSLLALVNGKWLNLVVPYPMGFFTKWVEGRIDDANAGWKGRGLWTTNSNRTMFHLEGGVQNRPKVVKFQMRPDPLAK